eukprot:5708780-Pleurochrysis_carterae.AAC.6
MRKKATSMSLRLGQGSHVLERVASPCTLITPCAYMRAATEERPKTTKQEARIGGQQIDGDTGCNEHLREEHNQG